MKKISLRITAILLSCMLLFTTGCAQQQARIGSGEPGIVAPIDWSGYDALIEQSRVETDLAKRELILHQAEDMLMDTGAICPLYYRNRPYLLRSDVHGFYFTPNGTPELWNVEKENSESLRVQIFMEPNTMDYTVTSLADAIGISGQIICALMYYDEDGTLLPDLAESYTISEDKQTYTFILREGLKWSDEKPLTAADFEYSWKRTADPATGSFYNYMFSCIKGYPNNLAVTASADGRTLTVELAQPCTYFLDLCALSTFMPIQQEYVESAPGYRDASGKVVNPSAWALEAGFPCCGPFILQSWEHDKNMVLVRNPYYYDVESPVKLDRVELMLAPDPAAAYAAYLSGDVDLIVSLHGDELERIRQSEEFHTNDVLGCDYIAFNVKDELFAGFTEDEAKTLRKALGCLIDRQALVDVVTFGGQQLANTFIPSGMSDSHGGEFRKNDSEYTYPYATETGYFPVAPDHDKARELLRSIGYTFDEQGKLNESLCIEYKASSGKADEKFAACLQQDFAELGIELRIETADWNVFIEEYQNGDFCMASSAWEADFNDAINMLEMWCSDSLNNDVQLGK